MEWLLSLQTLVVISSNGVLTSADLSSKQVVLVRKIMDKIWLQPYLAVKGLTSSLYKYLSTSPMPYIHQQVLGWSSCHASYNALQCTVLLPKMHKVKLKVEYAAVLCVDNNTYLSSYIRTTAPVLGQASQLIPHQIVLYSFQLYHHTNDHFHIQTCLHEAIPHHTSVATLCMKL